MLDLESQLISLVGHLGKASDHVRRERTIWMIRHVELVLTSHYAHPSMRSWYFHNGLSRYGMERRDLGFEFLKGRNPPLIYG